MIFIKNVILMEKKIIRINESQLRNIVTESVKRLINEAADPIEKINALINQANSAYKEAAEYQGGDEYPLMDKDGNSYGLTGNIRLDGRGYIIFPFNSFFGMYEPKRIRIISKAGGKLRILQGDYYTEGWRDAAKLLKSVIKDAKRGIGYLEKYDPNWEYSETKEEYKQNMASLKNMNKSIGLKSGVGSEYISKPV